MINLDQTHLPFHCPICGMAKVHYRLRGYKCPNEEHNERWQHIVDEVIKRCARNASLDFDAELEAVRLKVKEY